MATQPRLARECRVARRRGPHQGLALALARLAGQQGAAPAGDDLLQGRQILYEGVGVEINANLIHLILNIAWRTLSLILLVPATHEDPAHCAAAGAQQAATASQAVAGSLAAWSMTRVHCMHGEALPWWVGLSCLLLNCMKKQKVTQGYRCHPRRCQTRRWWSWQAPPVLLQCRPAGCKLGHVQTRRAWACPRPAAGGSGAALARARGPHHNGAHPLAPDGRPAIGARLSSLTSRNPVPLMMLSQNLAP